MFTQICIIVAGIIGAACSQHEQVYPIGDCTPYGTTLVCYIDNIEDLRVRTQPYMPHTCKDHEWNINCFYTPDGKSTGEQLGDLTPTKLGYNKMLACPNGMYGKILRFEEIEQDWQCRDSGEGITLKFGRWYTGTKEGFVYEWVVVVDFLVHEPEWWTYRLLPFKVIYDYDSNAMSKMVRIEEEGYLRHIVEFSTN